MANRPNYAILGVAAVAGVTLAALSGVGLMTVALKVGAGLLTYHCLNIGGKKLAQMQKAEHEAGLTGDKRRLYQLAIEALAAAAGAAVFVLCPPGLILLAIPGLWIGMLAHKYLKSWQADQPLAALNAEPAAPTTASE